MGNSENTLSKIVNLMERWHFGREEDAEVLEKINNVLTDAGMLRHFNRTNELIPVVHIDDLETFTVC